MVDLFSFSPLESMSRLIVGILSQYMAYKPPSSSTHLLADRPDVHSPPDLLVGNAVLLSDFHNPSEAS